MNLKQEEKTNNTYKDKSNNACDLAFHEIYPTLKNKYPKLSKSYKDVFYTPPMRLANSPELKAQYEKEHRDTYLLPEDFFKLKEWMYVRAKQILITRLECTFKDIFNSNHPYTETDKRMKMSELIQNYSHPFPQF